MTSFTTEFMKSLGPQASSQLAGTLANKFRLDHGGLGGLLGGLLGPKR